MTFAHATTGSTRKQTPISMAAGALGVAEARLGVLRRGLNLIEFEALGAAVSAVVAHAPERLLGQPGGGPVGRRLVLGSRGDVLAVCAGLVHLPAGVIGDHEVVVRLKQEQWQYRVDVLAPLDSAPGLLPAFQAWVEHVIVPGSVFRGGSYQVAAGHHGMALDRWIVGGATRADLMLDDRVWAAVDRHVHTALDLSTDLAAAGLAASSGVLCVGPPGTGKSQLARIVAGELGERATVLIPHAAASRRHLRPLLRLAARLSPTLVILDDLDLVVGSRGGGGDSEVLQEFLTSMDDVMGRSEGVVVMASTNEPRSIDPAAVRATRFDAVVEMTAPGREAREAILRRHLGRFELDFARLAGATSGATGADLADLARRAWLDTAGDLTTEAVLEAAGVGNWQEQLVTGAYL